MVLDEAGRQWARGVKLGEVKGTVVVNNVEVRLGPLHDMVSTDNLLTKIASVFTPSYAEVVVVCIHIRLPIYTIHDVASTVISAMRPTKYVILALHLFDTLNPMSALW